MRIHSFTFTINTLLETQIQENIQKNGIFTYDKLFLKRPEESILLMHADNVTEAEEYILLEAALARKYTVAS